MAVNSKYIDGLSNADGLDDSFFYNNDAGGKVSPEMIKAGAALTAGLISTVANRPRNTAKDEVKSVCGRKPLLGKAKKAAYQKCLDNYLKTKAAASQPAPQPPYTPPPMERSYATPPAPEKKKFLGMPMGVGITVTVLVVAAIGFGVYKFVLKK